MRVISLLLFVISFLFAQSNEDCLDCHSDQEMAKSVNDTLELSLFVDDSVYQESAHGGMDCIECHSTINDVDHPEDYRMLFAPIAMKILRKPMNKVSIVLPTSIPSRF
ncbi:MAG: hypothetical protein E4H13_07765 [Calditrichales bacterium]|nr:MAG: hypothetical protein E4H13_07765 [Calditrichales bacterium]